MNKKLHFTLIILILNTCVLLGQTKPNPIQVFINKPNLKQASISFCVKDFSGKQISAHNANKSLTPASILKVVTTATALETLGGNFRYKTAIAKDQDNPNNIQIYGYGDPTLGSSHFNAPKAFLSKWSEAIKQNVDTTQAVNISVIDNYFGYDGVSHRWIRQDMGNYYAAGAYGISVFDNTYKLFFNTTRLDTCPLITKMEPNVNGLTFNNTLTLNKTGRDNGYIFGEPLSNKRTLTGNIPSGKTSFSIKGDIPNPGLYLGQIIAESLNNKGIEIGEVTTSFDTYNRNRYSKEKQTFSEDIFFTHLSPSIKEIIQNINVRSNNHYAEHLIRTVGRSANSDIYTSALDEGINRTIQLWKSRGLNTNALFMYDGCGLAPSNAVSSAFMCDLLLYMKNKSQHADTFLQSLPRAGKNGTVRNLLKGTRLEGKVYVKSGSIVNVQCFAGYYINGDKKYAFTIMVNNYNGPRRQVVKAIEELLLATF